MISSSFLFISVDGSKIKKNVSEDGISKSYVDENNYRVLEIYEPRYYDGAEWQESDPSLKKKSLSENLELDKADYNVNIDKLKKEILIEKGGDTFTIEYEGEIISYTKNELSINYSNEYYDGVLIYVFNPLNITKLLRIDAVKGGLQDDFVFREKYKAVNNNNLIKIMEEVEIWDSSKGKDISFKKIKKEGNELQIIIPKEEFNTFVFPVYIDPSLDITGTESLGGNLSYDYITIFPGATLNINSTGYLNVTATYGIIVAGTINGDGLISYANGGAGGGSSLNY